MEIVPRVESPKRPEPSAARCAEDLALVRDILAGSTPAWHGFIQRYSRLIVSVIHRYVPRHRSEEARTLYVQVLESLYRRKLSHYEGRASLATWLVLVTRSAVVDDLRHRLGGRDLREAVRALPPLEREVFQRYYLEGLSFREVRGLVRDQGALLTMERLLEVLRALETRLAGRLERRLRYDLHAQSVGGASGRLLEYLDHVQLEFAQGETAASPEHALTEREARATLEKVREQLELLPADDRRLLTLRFEAGWTAERIASELGLSGQRRVYTWIERILRSLRRALKTGVQESREIATGAASAGRTRPDEDGNRTGDHGSH